MGDGKAKAGLGQWKLVAGREEVLTEIREDLKARMRASVMEIIHELFEEEKREFCGEPWSRKAPGQVRSGGTEKGSIYLEGRRARVTYPRVADGKESRSLASYQALRSFDAMSEEIQAKLLRGVSTRDYQDVVTAIAEGTALPKSTVSRAFVKASKKSLLEVNGRDLSKDLLVAVFLDGIGFGETLVVAALGVTAEGEKKLLGVAEGATENVAVVSDLLDNLVNRGLALTDRFLAVIDGAKALRAALVKRWGSRAVIARCQVHKKRNVAEHLSPRHAAEAKRRMNVAYGMKDYAEAEKVLRNTVRWLEQISEPAARSLEEGLEETLTVVKLGLPDVLRRTFSTTNPVESVFDGIRYRTGRVKRWRHGKGEMVMRWAAAAGMETEKRFRKILGYRLVNVLVEKLRTVPVDGRKEVG